MISKLVIIGVGLIGGSLARALREAEAVGEIIGCSKSEETRNIALKLDIIDRAETDMGKAVIGADMVIIATPVGAIKEVIEQIAPMISDGTIVSDVGSTKVSVINDVKSVLGVMPPWFVPAHPIAGTENSGVKHSFETLFSNRRVILTPTEQTDNDATLFVQKMWQTAGSEVLLMDAIVHDNILAATSHLPHILAYALVNQLSKTPEIFDYSGGGFKDFTRIALSDPTMWRDICLANGTEIAKLIKLYKKQLTEIELYIENNNADKLYELFEVSKKARETL